MLEGILGTLELDETLKGEDQSKRTYIGEHIFFSKFRQRGSANF